MATKKKKYQDGGESTKGKPTANVQINRSTRKPTGKKGLAYNSNPGLVYSKNPEGKVTETVQDLYRGKADSYKIRNKAEALGRTSGYLVKESKAYTLPAKEMKTNMPEKLQKGGTMKKMKTGGMVNSNSKITASKVAKGTVGGKSKAPKKAAPGRK